MRRARHPRSLSVVAMGGLTCLVAFVIVGGCASETEEGDVDASSTSSSGSSVIGTSSGSTSSGASGSNGSSGTSGGTSSGGLDSSIPDVSFVYDAPYAKDGDACATTNGVATKKLVDMFVMLDRSGSMNYPCTSVDPTGKCEGTMGQPQAKGDCNIGSGLESKWCHTINALSKYFQSSKATGNAAALQTFFTATPTTLCDGTSYNVSAVPGGMSGYTTLPSNGFDAFLNSSVPQGVTPTQAAVKGLTQFLARPANQRAGRLPIGVLVTDGDPTFCTTASTLAGEISAISTILQNHYNATSIPTFVIGMTGADFANLESMATGGNAPLHADSVGAISDACGNGAGPCRHWNIGDGTNEALAEALNQIQGFAVACKYNIPKPLVGAINYKDVSVDYKSGATTTPLTKVTDAAACVANGWYYDNNASPTTIILCPSECTTVQADSAAEIGVSFGCLGG